MDPNSALNPLIFTTIQNEYVTALSQLFGLINQYAISLFYVLAALEIAFFGLMWALKQHELMGQFLFKVIKLGFIFYLISHYASLLNILVNGLAHLSLQSVGPSAAKIIFSPDLLWKYGFDSAISLLSLAVQYGTTNIGVTAIYLVLGFGILLLFALIACQIILLIIGFYVLSLLALVFLPFGTFSLTENFLSTAIHSLFKGAVKIFAMILIVGIGVSIWTRFNTPFFTATSTLDQPLGLFFATLIIAILTWRVPAMAAESVGHLGGALFPPHSTPEPAPSPSVSVSAQSGSAQVAAATNIQAGTSLATHHASSLSTPGSASAATVSVAGGVAGGANLSGLNKGLSELNKAVKMHSENSAKKDTRR